MLRMRHSDTPKLPQLLVIDLQSNMVLRRVTLTLIGGEVDVREQMNAIILEEHPQLDSVRLLLSWETDVLSWGADVQDDYVCA